MEIKKIMENIKNKLGNDVYSFRSNVDWVGAWKLHDIIQHMFDDMFFDCENESDSELLNNVQSIETLKDLQRVFYKWNMSLINTTDKPEEFPIKCNNCESIFNESLDLELFQDGVDYFRGCPTCETDEYLTDTE